MNEHFFDNYHDRGMKKWAGFFLSEHTATMESLTAKEKKPNYAKPMMEINEITLSLHEAITKGKQISVQLLETNLEGFYPDDIIGKVQGYDNQGVYISGVPIKLENIRNVEFYSHLKWSDTGSNDTHE